MCNIHSICLRYVYEAKTGKTILNVLKFSLLLAKHCAQTIPDFSLNMQWDGFESNMKPEVMANLLQLSPKSAQYDTGLTFN